MKNDMLLFTLAVVLATENIFAADAVDSTRAQSLAQRTEGKVFRDAVTPHWLPDNQHFWYRVTTGPDAHEYVLVDASNGEIKRASSAEKLGVPEIQRISTSAQSSLVSKRTTHTGDETAIRLNNTTAGSVEVFWVDESGERKPYGRVPSGQTKEFHTYAGHVWLVTDSSGSPLGFFEATPDTLEVAVDGKPEKTEPPHSHRNRRESGQPPDGKFSVRFENENAVLVSASGETTLLTTNGSSKNPYRGPVVWSPDSQHCVVFLVSEVPRHIVTIVESSPRDQLQPKLQTYDYFKPGDALPQVQPVLINVTTKTAKVISDDLFTNNFTPDGEIGVRWSPRSDEFYFNYNQRGHQVYASLRSTPDRRGAGDRRRAEQDLHRLRAKTCRHWLDETDEILWMSERDGWNHLYLYDADTGTVKNQITHGDWVVRGVRKVDEQSGRSGSAPAACVPGRTRITSTLPRELRRHRLHCAHRGRRHAHDANSRPTAITSSTRWSRVDLPPVTELRRSDDGKLVCELERADDARSSRPAGRSPERFVAKGRDGETDIYGVIIRPRTSIPTKKYPGHRGHLRRPARIRSCPKRFGR